MVSPLRSSFAARVTMQRRWRHGPAVRARSGGLVDQNCSKLAGISSDGSVPNAAAAAAIGSALAARCSPMASRIASTRARGPNLNVLPARQAPEGPALHETPQLPSASRVFPQPARPPMVTSRLLYSTIPLLDLPIVPVCRPKKAAR